MSRAHAIDRLQRKCACGGSAGTFGECAVCQEAREDTLQRDAVGPAEAEVAPPIVHDVLRSSGESLDDATRAFMEPRFGRGFGDVRVHTGAT